MTTVDAVTPLADHPSPAQRKAWGKQVRGRVPRSALGDWNVPADRRDPVEMLQQQAETRVPELVPIRHARMLASPFTFYRGGAFLMAADLAEQPRTDLQVQLCGDAHLSNFGVYAAPDRRLVFSLNDFDETLPGPFEWDLQRLATSFAIAARSRGFSGKHRRTITRGAARAYREAMHQFAEMDTLDLWYARLDVDDLLAKFGSKVSSHQRERVDRTLSKATSKTSLKAARKLTHEVDGDLRFVSDPPLITPIEQLVPPHRAADVENAMHDVLRGYRSTLPADRRHLLERFRFVHVARKVVGVGSVGTRAWVMLLVGRDLDDPLLLQLKEAEASVLEPFLGASRLDNHGERVVAGQRVLQSASDIMLGWIRTTHIDGVERDYYVRQLWDRKGSADVDRMRRKDMQVYAKMCGWTLALAHARTGDPIAIAGYLGGGKAFDKAMTAFAEAYAAQNDRDYQAVQAAVADGRLEAATT